MGLDIAGQARHGEARQGVVRQGKARRGRYSKKIMKKKTWIYVMKPTSYEIACDKCDGSNITWSECVHKIWCHKCKIDTRGTGGVFDDPIPIRLCEELGISFDRHYLKSKKIRKLKAVEDKLVWK